MTLCIGCDSGGVRLPSPSGLADRAADGGCCSDHAASIEGVSAGRAAEESASPVRCGCVRIQFFGDPQPAVLTFGSNSVPGLAVRPSAGRLQVCRTGSGLRRALGERGPPSGHGSGSGPTLLGQRTSLLI